MIKENSAARVLAHLPGITPRRLAGWRQASLSLDDVLASEGQGLWSAATIHAAQEASRRERERAEKNRVVLVALDEPGYPELLSRIPDPPLVLRVRGRLAPSDPVAVVGARKADAYGRAMAETFARSLARAGSTVVSGLAYGVDAVAHRAALNEVGGTIAVLGSGVDVIYPGDHAGLAADIVAAGGALVSELPLGTGPKKEHFPKRNRILAALSLGTLVVQAGEKSGSLITARLSLDYDRLVWIVPGRIGDPLATGTLTLAREGAPVVTSPADILADLAPLGAAPLGASPSRPAADDEGQVLPTAASPPRNSLLAAIGSAGATIEEIATSTGRGRAELLSELLRCELSREVIAEPGGIYRLTGR